MYGTLKFKDLFTKPNPIINIFYKENEMSGVALNFNGRDFRAAFTVESFLAPIQKKDDPRYVKYLARIYGKKNGVQF